MSTESSTSLRNLPAGFYKIDSIKYPMASAYYKPKIKESSIEEVQFELAILFHSQSKGPKNRQPNSLVNKIIHIIESGTKQVTKDFQQKEVDYAIWQVLTKQIHQELTGQEIAEHSIYLKALNDKAMWDFFTLMKDQNFELAIVDEDLDPELSNDMEQDSNPELQNEMWAVEGLEKDNEE